MTMIEVLERAHHSAEERSRQCIGVAGSSDGYFSAEQSREVADREGTSVMRSVSRAPDGSSYVVFCALTAGG